MQYAALNCRYSSECSGCPWIDIPYDQQLKRKAENLRKQLENAGLQAPEIKVKAVDNHGLRDRVDLIYDENHGLGFFNKEKSRITDIDFCLQLSPKLNELLKRVREIRFPIRRGSLRLRVSPQGEFGVWLDFANLDVKNLIEEKTCLERLMQFARVEIGQRRKLLVNREGALKLADPDSFPWFQTWVAGEATPLYCHIGSFTQVGFRANHALVSTVEEMLKPITGGRAIEFGSGIGNFTLPLAAHFESVIACESDSLANQCLQKSLLGSALQSRISIVEGNHHLRNLLEFRKTDLILVDPPRSGLMKFLDPLLEMPEGELPPYIIYVSCYPESFAQDAAKMQQKGYKIREIHLVDQFSSSQHTEFITLFTFL